MQQNSMILRLTARSIISRLSCQIRGEKTGQPPNKALHPTAYSFARRSSSLRFRRRVSLVVRQSPLMQAYRGAKLAPTCLVVAVGVATLSMILWTLGAAMVTKWYFYPSVLFWLFSLLCAVTGRASSWHRFAWRGCQWWSGIWAFVFLLCFIPPWIGAAFGSIALDAGVNPFIAGGVHVLIWSCASDILKPDPARESPLNSHAEP